jgi:hypothetical protein
MSWNGVFMAEIQKHECLYNKFSREYRNRELRNECWQKVAEKFEMSPMAAEKKFRNIRTAYGRWLRKRRANPSRNGQDFIPFAFENCEWLGVHIIHRDSTLSNETTCSRAVDSGSEDDDSPVTMSNMEFLHFGDYNDSISPSNDNKDTSQHETTHAVETKSTVPQERMEIQTRHSNEAVTIDLTTNQGRLLGTGNSKQLISYNEKSNNTQVECSTTQSLIQTRDFPSEQIPNNSTILPVCQLKRKYSELEDEDDLYCRSLVPRLKRLTPEAKAYVRIQLEQLLYHAEYSGHTLKIGAPFGFHFTEKTQPTSFLNGRPIEQAASPVLTRD